MADNPVHYDPYAGRTNSTADSYEAAKKSAYNKAAGESAGKGHKGDGDSDMDDEIND